MSAALFCGCVSPAAYSFPNKAEEIETIELLYYPWYKNSNRGEFGEFITVRVLESADIISFMEAIYSIPTDKAGYEPPSNYGEYIARVNYANGDTEYFGSEHIEFVKNGERAYAVGDYYFVGDSFNKLFFEYSGITDPDM